MAEAEFIARVTCCQVEPVLIEVDRRRMLRARPGQRAAVQAGAVMKAMPTRKPNSDYRTREHLLEREVEALIKAAKGNRNGLRDSTIILMMWRHGLRVSEACGLQWADVSFEDAILYVRRAKGGEHGTHPIADDEIAALRTLQREAGSQWVFTSERGGPFERAGIARMIERSGIAAGLAFQCHPHQLRHACGYALVNRGVDTRTLQAFMGHRSSPAPRAMPRWHRAGSKASGVEASYAAFLVRLRRFLDYAGTPMRSALHNGLLLDF